MRQVASLNLIDVLRVRVVSTKTQESLPVSFLKAKPNKVICLPDTVLNKEPMMRLAKRLRW